MQENKMAKQILLQDYISSGARKIFCSQMREAYTSLEKVDNAKDEHISYAKECLEKMKEVNKDWSVLEKIGLIDETTYSLGFHMDKDIKDLTNKLNEIEEAK